MKILLTGKDGQVGFALHKKLMSLGEVIATGRHELDLANPEAIKALIDKIQPDIIINPAAYTQVEQAENEPQLAYQINVVAPQVLTEKASELNIPIIHFSTCYIFDGLKNEPYIETDQANPQSVYGQTKWQGEEVVRQYKKHIILRTSWVFGSYGQNFLKTILKSIQEKKYLTVVSDQQGTPTSNEFLADITCKIVKVILDKPNLKYFGTYHLTSSGHTNWYHYACLIAEEFIRLGLKTSMTSQEIKAILSDEYETAVKRPLNSILNKEKIKNIFMLELPNWEEQVKDAIYKIFTAINDK
jgi:dTDP-4-dehydrorhamnose reductase